MSKVEKKGATHTYDGRNIICTNKSLSEVLALMETSNDSIFNDENVVVLCLNSEQSDDE